MKWILVAAAVALSSCSLTQKKEEAAAPPPAHLAGYAYECHKLESVKDGSYCIHTKGTPTRTLWYFHGAGCNQDVLQDTTTCIPGKEGSSEKEFMSRLQNVAVITVSFGPIWLADPIEPKTMADKDATVEKFVKRIVPELEQKHRLAKPYMALGHSMGGFNAAEISLSEPELFERVVLMHPMFPTCDLFSGEIINEDCWPDHMVKAEFPKKKWPQVNPLERVKTAPRIPPTWVQVCGTDEFDLVDGPLAYADTAMRRGFAVYSEHKTSGCNHFEWNVSSALEFLK